MVHKAPKGNGRFQPAYERFQQDWAAVAEQPRRFLLTEGDVQDGIQQS
jgi:hypothetical protein